MATTWRYWLYGLCAVTMSFALFLGYKTHLRSERTAQIQTEIDDLKIRQLDLKNRFDKFEAESAKAPNDPVVLKELGARHLKLVEENEALKADLGRIQKELDANKR
jgi:hypothetical protein